MKQLHTIAIALGSFFAALAATQAQADTPIYNWNGIYLGGEASGIFGTTHRNFSNGSYSSGNSSVGGVMGGATLGYNDQWRGLVVGIETDFSGGEAKGKGVRGRDNYYIDSNWLGTFRPRVGYDFGGILPYATAGVAGGDVHVGASNNITGAHYLNDTQPRFGWTAGGGVETAIDREWSFKAEYLHVDLANTEATNNVDVHSVTKFNENVVRVGLNYAFR